VPQRVGAEFLIDPCGPEPVFEPSGHLSRSGLQLKMDLDPDIEAVTRETEKHSVDLVDEKQVKPILRNHVLPRSNLKKSIRVIHTRLLN